MLGNNYSTRLAKRHARELHRHRAASQAHAMRLHMTSANLAWPHRSPLQPE